MKYNQKQKNKKTGNMKHAFFYLLYLIGTIIVYEWTLLPFFSVYI